MSDHIVSGGHSADLVSTSADSNRPGLDVAAPNGEPNRPPIYYRHPLVSLLIAGLLLATLLGLLAVAGGAR